MKLSKIVFSIDELAKISAKHNLVLVLGLIMIITLGCKTSKIFTGTPEIADRLTINSPLGDEEFKQLSGYLFVKPGKDGALVHLHIDLGNYELDAENIENLENDMAYRKDEVKLRLTNVIFKTPTSLEELKSQDNFSVRQYADNGLYQFAQGSADSKITIEKIEKGFAHGRIYYTEAYTTPKGKVLGTFKAKLIGEEMKKLVGTNDE